MELEQEKPRSALQEGDVPKDLARLKNWSNFEEASYRDFSQQRAERRSITHRRVEESRKGQPSLAPPAAAPAGPVPEPAPTTLVAAANSAPLLTNPDASTAQAAQGARAFSSVPAAQRSTAAAPVAVAVFSPVGGVGRSMLSAHLARSLYTRGERVLLVNASGHSLLSMHFGSSAEREGLRQFCAPGENHASVLLYHREHPERTWLEHEVEPLMQSVDRTIFDLGNAAPEIVEHILSMCQAVLVPVTPSAQAVHSARRVVHLMERLGRRHPQAPPVYFVMNQFDEGRDQHATMRSSLEDLCGDCFAPVALSASDELHQAFEERMTLGDYHPSAPLAQQFERLAGWLRKILPPASPAHARRWSEK